MIFKGILLFLILLFIPTLTGLAVCRILRINKKASAYFLVGSFVEWAFIQIISVPLIIYRCSFSAVVILLSVILGILSIYGICILIREKDKIKTPKQEIAFESLFAIVLMVGAYIYLAVSLFKMQYISYDDSRFVVNAVDIVETNRMFLTNPSTGDMLTGFWGDLHRDVISPWAVYIAYVSKISNISVAIIAHTVLPQILLLCMISVYWLIADEFFHGNLFAICGMVFIGLLVNLFGARDGWDAESFAMETFWQGKAVVAAVGIPALFLGSVWIYKEPNGWRKYLFLYGVSFSLCLMSGMGIIIGGLVIGAVGLIYGILKRKITVALKIWIGLLIPLTYYGISMLSY